MSMKTRLMLAGSVAAIAAAALFLRDTGKPMSFAGAGVGDGDEDAVEAYRYYDVKDAWRDMSLPATTLANGALFAQAVTQEGMDPGLVRIDTATGKLQFDESGDGAHDNGETVNLVAFKGDLAALGIDGEMGSVNPYVNGFGMIHDIQFQNTYTNPVMFAQVTTHLGAPAIAVMPTNVQSTWGRLKFYEAPTNDGTHWGETIHWMVIEAGTYDLANGQRLIVGKQAVATTGTDDFDSISVSGQFLGDAAVIANIQQFNNHKYQGTRIEKTTGVNGTLLSFGMRFMGPAGDDGNMTGTIGYLALGTAWSLKPGHVTLSKSDGTSVGIRYAQHSNGHCFNLSDENFNDSADSLLFKANGSRTIVVAYEHAWCSGTKVATSANGTFTGSLNFAGGSLANKVSSIRVMWASEAQLEPGECFSRGDVLVQNALSWLIFQDDGNLVLYRYMPADSSLSVAWESGTEGAQATEACFTANGNLKLKTALNLTVWQSNTTTNVDHLALGSDCNVKIKDTSGNTLWNAGADDCWKDLPAAAPNGMPEISIGYADLDADNDEEMILISKLADGTGYMMIDPIGIADFFFNTLGYGLGDDFWYALSSTQQQGLLSQIADVSEAGADNLVSGTEIETLMGEFDGEYRSYNSFHFSGSGTLFNGTLEGGIFDYGVTVGEGSFMVEYDEFGHGYEIEGTLVTLTQSTAGGYIKTETTVLSGKAAWNIDKNAYSNGAGVSLVEVTYTAGNENGTYASVSYGVGLSYFVAARWGKNDQYGFTIDVPIIPVGISVYVKGSDAVAAWNDFPGWVYDASYAVADATIDAWTKVSNFAQQNPEDMVAAVANTAEDAIYSLARTGATVAVGATQAGKSTYTYVTNGGLEDTAAAVAEGIAEGFDAVSEAITEWAAGGGAEEVVETVVEEVEEVAEEVVEEVEEIVDEICKGLKWLC